MLSVLSSASIPVISILMKGTVKDFLISALAASSTVAITITNIYSFNENWSRYRRYAELFKSECFRFVTKKGDYAGENAEELLIGRIETMADSENNEWLQARKNAKTAENKSMQYCTKNQEP